MLELALATLFFVGIHLAIAGTRIRFAIAEKTGEVGFRIGFSVLSLAGIWWMVSAYNDAPYQETWGQLIGLAPVVHTTMLIAAFLVVGGVLAKNPGVAGQEKFAGAERAKGIFALTRHPFLWGVAVWAASHLLVNGDLAALIFFGGFLVLGVYGPFSIDAKRRVQVGPQWRAYEDASSAVPLVALIQRRAKFRFRDVPWYVWLTSIALYLGLFKSHAWLFGVRPF